MFIKFYLYPTKILDKSIETALYVLQNLLKIGNFENVCAFLKILPRLEKNKTKNV